MIFEESGLLFTFSDAWQVYPFDDHRYYRWLSGRGLRGVDFMGIYQGRLVLIEIKNYRRREGMPAADALQGIREDLEGFACKMLEKVAGSLRVVREVNVYYRRRWWFYWFERLPVFLKRRYPHSYFWYVVSELAADPTKCCFVLWLEADGDTAPLERNILTTLTSDLSGSVGEIIIANQKRPPFGTDVAVATIWKD